MTFLEALTPKSLIFKALALGLSCGTLLAFGLPAEAGSTTPVLTFPPKSDCSFLQEPAQQACFARRGAAAQELAKVRSGKIKTLPPMTLPDNGTPSAGGGFAPLAEPGSLGGLTESKTLPASSDAAPSRSTPYNPNAIGNPWAGTPSADGTGIPTHN